MIPQQIVLQESEYGWKICKETPAGLRTIEGPYRRHAYALKRFDLITGGRTVPRTNHQFPRRL